MTLGSADQRRVRCELRQSETFVSESRDGTLIRIRPQRHREAIARAGAAPRSRPGSLLDVINAEAAGKPGSSDDGRRVFFVSRVTAEGWR